MTVMDFEEFTRKVYVKSIYKTLKSIVESKELKGSFLEMSYKNQKDFEEQLKDSADKISYQLIDLLKSKGFPEADISESDEKELLKEAINEYLSKEVTSSN